MERVPHVEQAAPRLELCRKSEAPALDRGLAILELLDAAPGGLILTEISAAIGSPKNSTSRLLQALMDRGYVARDEVAMRHSLTGKLLRMGQPQTRDVSLVECALEPMRGLRGAIGETVQLGIAVGDEGVIIEKLESLRAVRIGVNIGLRFPLHNNAPGKVLLAFREAPERDGAIARIPLERSTSRTITSRSKLREECEGVAARGFATDYGEADEGIHCVAAPIRDGRQGLVGTVWVSGIAGRMPKRRFAEVAREVVNAAGAIERRMQA